MTMSPRSEAVKEPVSASSPGMSLSPSPLQVSVVLCTHNRAADLAETLRGMQTGPGNREFNAEVVVVDNASTDDTAQVVRQAPAGPFQLRYVQEPRKGKSYAYNTGLAHARGEVLVSTDDDVRVPADWLAAMAGPVLAGQADAVAGSIRLAPHLERPWMKTAHLKCLASTSGREGKAEISLIGANMAFGRRVLEKVPGFDVELGPGALGLGEDDLFGYQLQEAGYRLVQARSGQVEHHFQPARLQRRAFLDMARKSGVKNAYLLHHWTHGAPARPFWNYWLYLARWNRRRYFTRAPAPESEGCLEWDMSLTKRTAFYAQFLAERRRARNYAQRGLVKLHGPGGRG